MTETEYWREKYGHMTETDYWREKHAWFSTREKARAGELSHDEFADFMRKTLLLEQWEYDTAADKEYDRLEEEAERQEAERQRLNQEAERQKAKLSAQQMYERQKATLARLDAEFAKIRVQQFVDDAEGVIIID